MKKKSSDYVFPIIFFLECISNNLVHSHLNVCWFSKKYACLEKYGKMDR